MSRSPALTLRHALTALAAAALLLLASPVSAALASKAQQGILQDDNELIFSTPQTQFETLQTLKSLGVDVVKVSLLWSAVAPKPDARHKPKFNASDPAAYPWGSWSRYDSLVRNAHLLGMQVYFQFVPRDPRWAAARNVPSGQGFQHSQAPNLAYFANWVKAVGKRYAGRWHDIHGMTIPRVSYWGIWNEPNWEGSLNPWHRKIKAGRELTQPPLYRGIVNTAFKALSATGHRSDTILAGETADFGNIPPLRFLQDVYCVGHSDRLLSGRSAALVGCPTSPKGSKFVSQNPGLFKTTGWSHHPYGFDVPPDRPSKIHSEIALYNVSELERALNGIFSAYHHGRAGGIPIYLTEWGYVTNPPNPVYHATPSDQAKWLDQGEYLVWRDSYVKALAQFELVDPPTPSHQSRRAWSRAFTSGLEFQDGSPKPALDAYRLPIWVPNPSPGSSVAVWGQLRPADHSGAQTGEIEFEPQGSSSWQVLSNVQTNNSEGFLLTHVSVPGPGLLRLGWQASDGTMYFSRGVTIS